MGFMDWITSAVTGEEEEDKKSEDLVGQILDQYQDIDAPQFSAPQYEQLAYAPISSEWEGVATDPRLRDQQLASMGALDEIVSGGGLTQADAANLQAIQSQAATADKGRRDAILQNLASRGMGGSGNELLAQLQSSQAATNRQAQQGLDVAGMAQQRALDAIMSQGQIAGNVRGQDFGQQAERASNVDAINRFNQANVYDASRYNVGTQNQAADQENIRKQQEFENLMSVKSGTSGALGAGSDYYTRIGDRKSAVKGNIIGGVVKAGAAGASAYAGGA